MSFEHSSVAALDGSTKLSRYVRVIHTTACSHTALRWLRHLNYNTPIPGNVPALSMCWRRPLLLVLHGRLPG